MCPSRMASHEGECPSRRILKPLVWIASSRRDLKAFPEAVKDVMGYALYLAQVGRSTRRQRLSGGFGSASVLEIVEDGAGGTYCGVYTVQFAGVVYVPHCFQKKSRRGIATAKPDLDLIKRRLLIASEDYRKRTAEKK